jgi:predicted nucleic acid-binding protein
MGSPGIGKGVSRDVVLDAGALIAFERGDENLKAILRGVLATKARVVIPAAVLAQVWRGGPSAAPTTRLIDAGEIDPLDEERAKEIGVRLGIRGTSDVADAQVVCSALEYRAMVATSDSDDIQALAEPGERLTVIAV